MNKHDFLEITDLGRVVEVNVPAGVSWMKFGGLALTDYIDDKVEEANGLCIVPVATAELAAVVGKQPEVGDGFFSKINLAATSMADVYPSEFQYSPPLTPQEIKEFWKPQGEQ